MKCDREVTWLYFKQKIAYVRNDLTTHFNDPKMIQINICWYCVPFVSNKWKINWKCRERIAWVG